MNDDSQILIPPSFVALFVTRGQIKPHASRAEITERYEFCEDLATLMTEHAKAMLFDLGIAESDVLDRCHRGLLEQASGLTPPQAGWVVRRLAELLEWACPPEIG